ncbi:MAG: helix-turn-helix transcriptional regulator, partial [Spirochaetales bacterium]|nr:helix-turn-helix transcriptional regulator [Spirochaetales bacterium]
GIICFLWGAITLGYLVQKIFRQDVPDKDSLSAEFLAQFGITVREREIITLLLQGKSNRDIGEKLFVSPRTVEAHIYNIYRKCSVKNKLELSNLISNTS